MLSFVSKSPSVSNSRPLGLLDLTCLGINAIVGSGIFLFPGTLAKNLGPASVLAFGVTALLLMPVALCFAKASRLFEGHGGPYLYARQAFGPHVGYAIGWMCWVTVIFSWAAVANGLSPYLTVFFPARAGQQGVDPLIAKIVAVAVIALLGWINYRGVKLGAWTLNVFTVAKLVPLLLFAGIGLAYIQPALYHPWTPHGFKNLGASCLLAFFAFQGFEVVPVPAGEAAGAQRNVPRALIAALGLSALLYMIIQSVAVGVYPNLAGDSRPLAGAANYMLGSVGATVIAVGALLSMFGFNAGCALGGPRYLVALSEHGDWPRALSAAHARFGTPFRAILLTAGLAACAAVLLDFDKLVNTSLMVLCAQYLATCAAVPVLFRNEATDFISKLKLWSLPVIGIGATLWLGAQGGWAQIMGAFVLLLSGFLLKPILKVVEIQSLRLKFRSTPK